MTDDTSKATKKATADGLSQFAARILDQLSISSWLPSATLVLITVVYYELADNGGVFDRALEDISTATVPQLIAFVGAVILTTTIAQAFEFEAIRFLEGYWGTGWVARGAISLGMRLQRFRKWWLERRLRFERNCAAKAVTRHLEQKKVDNLVIEAAAARLRLGKEPTGLTSSQRSTAKAVNWERYSSAVTVNQFHALGEDIQHRFPGKSYDLMPTKLGNILKAHERQAL